VNVNETSERKFRDSISSSPSPSVVEKRDPRLEGHEGIGCKEVIIEGPEGLRLEELETCVLTTLIGRDVRAVSLGRGKNQS
jgi:hypothetical protein